MSGGTSSIQTTKSKVKLAHLAREWIASKGQIAVANRVALQACVQAHNEGQIASKGPIYIPSWTF